ncbi:MAG TPA: hypothetical protein VJN94_00545, partial [Candidatus Binataceae bacterium]|nr:hypothetical protein [Candidatus Binataceae bacterium]
MPREAGKLAQPPPAERTLHLLPQLAVHIGNKTEQARRFVWLRDEVVKATKFGAFLGSTVGLACKRNEYRAGSAVFPAKLLREVISAAIRHVEIEQHKARLECA